MDDCDAVPALVGGGAAMLVGGDEAVWCEAVCDAARSIGSRPSLGENKDVQSSVEQAVLDVLSGLVYGWALL